MHPSVIAHGHVSTFLRRIHASAPACQSAHPDFLCETCVTGMGCTPATCPKGRQPKSQTCNLESSVGSTTATHKLARDTDVVCPAGITACELCAKGYYNSNDYLGTPGLRNVGNADDLCTPCAAGLYTAATGADNVNACLTIKCPHGESACFPALSYLSCPHPVASHGKVSDFRRSRT